MIYLLGIATAFAGIFAFVMLYVLPVKDAELSGELEMRRPLSWKTETLRRSEDPEKFQLEVRKIRAWPWISCCVVAFVVLMVGLTQ